MSLYFNRAYRLEVGAPVIYSKDMGPINLDTIREGDLVKKKFVFTENQMSFNIKKTDKKDKNQSTFKIYNTNREFSSFLEQNQGKDVTVAFWGGYFPPTGDISIKKLFNGTVSYYLDTFNETERIVELVCQEGAVITSESKTARSYREGTPINTIIDDLVKDLNVTQSKIEKLDNNTVLESSQSFNGNTADILQTVLDKYRMNYTIGDNNSIEIISPDKHFKSNYVPLINTETGLIGDIDNWDEDEGTKVQDKLKKKTGYVVKTLLNGDYTINNTVAVESRTLNSGRTTQLKVARLEHSGSFMEDDWTTKLFLKSGTKEASAK